MTRTGFVDFADALTTQDAETMGAASRVARRANAREAAGWETLPELIRRADYLPRQGRRLDATLGGPVLHSAGRRRPGVCQAASWTGNWLKPIPRILTVVRPPHPAGTISRRHRKRSTAQGRHSWRAWAVEDDRDTGGRQHSPDRRRGTKEIAQGARSFERVSPIDTGCAGATEGRLIKPGKRFHGPFPLEQPSTLA